MTPNSRHSFTEGHRARISAALRKHWDTPERHERDAWIVELGKKGVPGAEISHRLKVPRTTIDRVLRNAGLGRHRDAPRTVAQLEHLEKLRRTWCLSQENLEHLELIRKPQNLKQQPMELKPSTVQALPYQERLAMYEVTNRPDTPRFENAQRAALAERLVSRFLEGQTPKEIAALEKLPLAMVEALIREWMLARSPLGNPGRAERVRRRIVELGSRGLTSLAIKVRIDREFPSPNGRSAATKATIRRILEEEALTGDSRVGPTHGRRNDGVL